MKRRLGFTLIEMLIYIAIVGILALIIVPRLLHRSPSFQMTRAKEAAEAIGKCGQSCEELAKACLYLPEAVNGENWLGIARGHGYVPHDNAPGGYGGPELVIKPWKEKEIFASPTLLSKTWWMYETYGQRKAPYLLHGRGLNKVCHVIFADGHVETLNAAGLKALGIKDEPSVLADSGYVTTWSQWSKP